MATPDKRGRSVRLVARHISELTMARWLRWKALAPDERLSNVVFDAVLSAGISHYPLRNPESGQWVGINEASLLGRPVTGTAIAHSMHLSYTTVRRQAADLVEAGLLMRDAGGFRIAEGLFSDGSIGRISVADTADLTRCLKALAEAGYGPATIEFAALPASVVARLIVDFALRALETFTQLYDNATTGVIMTAIIAANVRHINAHPELSQLYAAENLPPPDALRRPITVRALAREIGIPFETVRRHVAQLITDGRVRQKDDGVFVSSELLLSKKYVDNNLRIVIHFDQMVSTLASLAT